MPVSPIDLKNQTTVGAPKREPNSTLGKDDFLMLMVGKLQNQDPMNPTDDSQFMAQMAQMTSLEQMTNMASAMNRTEAFSMLGKSVSYTGKDGTVAVGTVDKVVMEGTKVKLRIGDQDVELDKVSSVLNGTADQPTTGSSPTTGGTASNGTSEQPAQGGSENPNP